jgi:lysyl endopeptidase
MLKFEIIFFVRFKSPNFGELNHPYNFIKNEDNCFSRNTTRHDTTRHDTTRHDTNPILFKILAIVIFTCFVISNAKSQVITRELSDKENLEDYLFFPIESNSKTFVQPKIDFERVLKDDEKKGIEMPRFAVKTNVLYTLDDGKWENYRHQAIWKIKFSAPHASSISLMFDQILLSENAEMYIYSIDDKIIQGPIKAKNLFKDKFTSDVIATQNLQIAILCPISEQSENSLIVTNLCQGILKKLDNREDIGWTKALDCNIDVNCPIASNWSIERDAVALLLMDATHACSGTLLNNQCQDLTPNFLTAFHCIQNYNAQNFVFRFKFESGSPTCPGNSTGSQGTWITFNGSSVRASSSISDFALLLMNGNITNQPNITLAGWNRDSVPPTSTTIIHHPAGDAKKIAFVTSTATKALYQNSKDWRLYLSFGNGALEGGSSGAGYFDQNKRIVGQHHGTNPFIPLPLCEKYDKYGGRFDISWTGGGTNTTRLSNWLSGNNPPVTINSIRSPFFNNALEYICSSSNKSITLNSPIPGKTITWSVSNPALFANGAGASTTGSGTVATIRALNGSISGTAALIFTLSSPGCNNVIVTQDLWLGVPRYPNISPSGYLPLNVGYSETIYLSGTPGAPNGTLASWTSSGNVSVITPTPLSFASFQANYSGYGNGYATSSNICGTSSPAVVNFYTPNNKIGAYPSVTQDQVHIMSLNNKNELDLTSDLNSTLKKLIIYDNTGSIKMAKFFTYDNEAVDLSSFQNGIYFIEIKEADGSSNKTRVIVQH